MIDVEDTDQEDSPGITVTALYVFKQLTRHEKVCAKRWWWLMTVVISGQAIIIGQGLLEYWQRHP